MRGRGCASCRRERAAGRRRSGREPGRGAGRRAGSAGVAGPLRDAWPPPRRAPPGGGARPTSLPPSRRLPFRHRGRLFCAGEAPSGRQNRRAFLRAGLGTQRGGAESADGGTARPGVDAPEPRWGPPARPPGSSARRDAGPAAHPRGPEHALHPPDRPQPPGGSPEGRAEDGTGALPGASGVRLLNPGPASGVVGAARLQVRGRPSPRGASASCAGQRPQQPPLAGRSASSYPRAPLGRPPRSRRVSPSHFWEVRGVVEAALQEALRGEAPGRPTVSSMPRRRGCSEGCETCLPSPRTFRGLPE